MNTLESQVAVNVVKIEDNEKDIVRLDVCKADKKITDIVKSLVFGMVGLILIGFAGFLIDLVLKR